MDDDEYEGNDRKQPHLKAQDASAVDPSKLSALSPEVVSLKAACERFQL